MVKHILEFQHLDLFIIAKILLRLKYTLIKVDAG